MERETSSRTNIRITARKTKAAAIAGCEESETGVATTATAKKKKKKKRKRQGEEKKRRQRTIGERKRRTKYGRRRRRGGRCTRERAGGEKNVEGRKKKMARSLAAGLPRRSRPGSICITGIYRQRGPAWRQNRACPRYVISLDSSSRDGRVWRSFGDERDGGWEGGTVEDTERDGEKRRFGRRRLRCFSLQRTR